MSRRVSYHGRRKPLLCLCKRRVTRKHRAVLPLHRTKEIANQNNPSKLAQASRNGLWSYTHRYCMRMQGVKEAPLICTCTISAGSNAASMAACEPDAIAAL